MTLVPIDPSNEASVVTLLERAAQWLSEAVHRGEPGDIAMVKAQMATAAEATKQLGLSKDIQLDAQEMVRRAEYALGKAIRRGQAEGTVAVTGVHTTGWSNQHGSAGNPDKVISSVSDFISEGNETRRQIMELADAPESPADFDQAIAEAKAEENLTRANVARKIKGGREPSPVVVTRDMRADLIATLAEQGYSSRQMPEKVGVTEETVRRIAREFEIDIPGDKAIGRTRRLDHTQMVESVVTTLDNQASALGLIELTEADMTEADEWVSSLTNSIRALNRFIKQIKEQTHV